MTDAQHTYLEDRLGYDPQTKTYHLQYDWNDDAPLSEYVAGAVAAVTDRDRSELGALYESIDPAALDRILQPVVGDELRKDGGCVAFTYADCDITVYWDGEVTIHPSRELFLD